MRLDTRVNTQDAYYRVTLDGVEQSECVMADDELGEIEVLKKDENGRFITGVDEDGEPYIEYNKLHGKVVITEIYSGNR